MRWSICMGITAACNWSDGSNTTSHGPAQELYRFNWVTGESPRPTVWWNRGTPVTAVELVAENHLEGHSSSRPGSNREWTWSLLDPFFATGLRCAYARSIDDEYKDRSAVSWMGRTSYMNDVDVAMQMKYKYFLDDEWLFHNTECMIHILSWSTTNIFEHPNTDYSVNSTPPTGFC